jgi:hypothetical protein
VHLEQRDADAKQYLGAFVEEHVPHTQRDLWPQRVDEQTHKPLQRDEGELEAITDKKPNSQRAVFKRNAVYYSMAAVLVYSG